MDAIFANPSATTDVSAESILAAYDKFKKIKPVERLRVECGLMAYQWLKDNLSDAGKPEPRLDAIYGLPVVIVHHRGPWYCKVEPAHAAEGE